MQAHSGIKTGIIAGLTLKDLLPIAATAILYFGLARTSLEFAFEYSNATPIWPPSGFAFAVILYFGRKVIPGIFLGAFIANMVEFQENQTAPFQTAIIASLFIAAGNTGEAVVGRFLLKKMLPQMKLVNLFRKVNKVICFSLVTLLMCIVSALIGSLVMYATGVIATGQYLTVLLTWWTGDVAGVFLISPLLLSWIAPLAYRTPTTLHKSLEAVLLLIAVIFVSGLVFQVWFTTSFFFTRAFLFIPFLVWAAVSFDQRMVVIVLLISAIMALMGTTQGLGPFFNESVNSSLLTVQAFVSINSIMALLLNAAITEQKEARQILTTAHDNLEKLVTDRTAELSRSKLQLEEAQHLARIGSWEWDVVNDRLTWSNEMYSIYGADKKNFHPSYESFLSLVHPDDVEKVDGIIKQNSVSGGSFDFYHRILKPNGEVRILHSRGECVLDNYGKMMKMAGTGQDVTEKKKAEELLLHTSQQLEFKNNELERSNKELASFSYIASHDLQEPLRKIQTFSERIEFYDLNNLSEKSKDYFGRINKAAAHMKRLIEDLLSYSRVTTQESFLEISDLNELILEVKTELQETIDGKRATIEVETLPRLKIIKFQFKQLINNLLNNSLKFTREGVDPYITIKAKSIQAKDMTGNIENPGKTYWQITIADNGIGFDPEHKKNIFEIFQRLHGRSQYEGTGIGLAICKKIVDNHHGIITADGSINEGARFDIFLPTDYGSS